MLNLAQRRRRACYRAWRRGTRETDLLLGRFASAHCDMDESQLAAFEALLDESDENIHDWLMSDELYQGQHQQMIEAIRAFHGG